jgi:hypothetical protein
MSGVNRSGSRSLSPTSRMASVAAEAAARARMKRMRKATEAMYDALQEVKKLEKLLQEAEDCLARAKLAEFPPRILDATAQEVDHLKESIKAATEKLEEAGKNDHFAGGRRRSTRRKRKGTRRH